MTDRVVVVGATAWGTTLAALLARGGREVALWARSDDEASTLDRDRENRRRRPGLRFPDSLVVTADDAVLSEASLVVLAVPAATLRVNVERLGPRLDRGATILSGIKGIEPETGLRVSEVLESLGFAHERLLVLSGPNFSSEIAAGLPAASVIAGADPERVRAAQALFMTPTFRVYASDDVVGVELGGALKNPVAIACGVSDGLGFGENARAGLMTRALAEIARLGVAAGARALTFLGLAGIGDLIATCGSDLSRNRQLGIALAAGKPLSEALSGVDGVVEGVGTTRAALLLARRLSIEMPITDELSAVLFDGKDPRRAVVDLMLRAAKDEFGDFPSVHG